MVIGVNRSPPSTHTNKNLTLYFFSFCLTLIFSRAFSLTLLLNTFLPYNLLNWWKSSQTPAVLSLTHQDLFSSQEAEQFLMKVGWPHFFSSHNGTKTQHEWWQRQMNNFWFSGFASFRTEYNKFILLIIPVPFTSSLFLNFFRLSCHISFFFTH